MHQNIKNQDGFTLIEIVLVILAIGIIGTMAAAMLGQGADIYKETVYRQSFLGQARSTFWRLGREAGNQQKTEHFSLSSATNFYVTNAKSETIQFAFSGSNGLNYTSPSSTIYPLSNQLNPQTSTLRYYNDELSEIALTTGQSLTQSRADSVRLIYMDMVFKKDDDSVRFSSFIYPQNFRFGKKMSYHE